MVAPILIASFLVGCGGGGGGGSSVAPPPPATPSPSPAPIGAFATLDPTLLGLQSLAPFGGYSGQVNFQQIVSRPGTVTAGTTFTELTSVAAPIPLPAFPTVQNTAVTPVALTYVTLTPSATFSLPAGPVFELTIPAGVNIAGYQLRLEIANTSETPVTWNIAPQPANAVGPNVFDFFAAALPFSLVAGKPVVCAFLALPQITASPSQTRLVGIGTTAVVTASEPQYSGSFTAVSADPSVVTVTSNANNAFTVTAVAVGSTAIHLTDSRGITTDAYVTVTSISLGVS